MKRLMTFLGLIVPFVVVVSAFGQQSAEEYFNKGNGFYEAQNYKAAADAFEKTIELKPDYAEAHYNLGITSWQQKQYTKAAEELQKVIEIAPNSEIAERAKQDIKSLKSAGLVVIVPPAEKPKEEVAEEETETAEKIKPSERPAASLPELVADIEFGPVSKRIAAAKGLGFFPGKEAVAALGKTVEKNEELPEIKTAAVESLGKIADPTAIPFLQTALDTNGFPAEGKQAAIKALSAINTPESLKAILSAWAGTFPGGLSDQGVVELIRKNGRAEFADIIRPAYLQNSGEKKIYLALGLGLLKDATGVPVMVSRLKEDYPGDLSPKSSVNQPPQRQPGTTGVPVNIGIPSMPPGMPKAPGIPVPGGRPVTGTILKEQVTEAKGWSRKDEAGLRTEIVEIMGICAGANQKPFLAYLSKNDQEKKVRDAALKAVNVLEARIAVSNEAYQKGLALAKEGKITEAINSFQTALKENPDASYAGEIKKLQARANYEKALVLLKEEKKEDAIKLLRSALELDPGAPFRKEIEAKLSELQAPATAYGPGGTRVPTGPGMPPIPGMPAPPPPRAR